MILVIITGIYLLLFVILTTIFLGWQTSISNNYKSLPEGYKWIFVVFMMILGSLCIAIGKDNAMTIAGFGCWFVGCFPRFYDDQNVQHYIGALAIIAGGMWEVTVVKEFWYLPIIFLGVIGIIILLKFKNRILWIELVAFVIIITGLWISTGMAR